MPMVSPQLDASRMSGINQGRDKSLSTWRPISENDLRTNVTAEQRGLGNSSFGNWFQGRQSRRYQRSKVRRIDRAIRFIRSGSRIPRIAEARDAGASGRETFSHPAAAA